ncbi:RecA protein [Streptococcus sp. HSISB1]|nr:RecA protein [Streptococcus sp. HSISB1]
MAKKTKKTEAITKKFGDERKKALDDALKLIEKDFGKGAVMRLGERAEQKVQVMSTGSLALDIALGAGGYPKGRIIEIYGPESSGKTTVALHAVAQAQKEGGIAAFIDAEHALDPAYAAALGVNIDELLLSQPDSGEQGLEIAGKLIDSGAVDLVVVDSVAALVPRAEIDGDIGDNHVGLQARMMSQAMRKLSASINKTKQSLSLSTNCVKKLVSCLVIQKQHLVDVLLNSIHQFVLMFVEIHKLKVLVTKKIATSVKKLKSKLLKTKLLHRLKLLKWKSCTVKEFHVQVS